MKLRKNAAFMLALTMVFSLFAGLMSVNVNAEGDKAQIKLEVYEMAADGDFGRQLVTEGTSKESLKVGKDYIVVMQAYNASKLFEPYGLDTMQLQLLYNSNDLAQQAVKQAGVVKDESTFTTSASGQPLSESMYAQQVFVSKNSKIGSRDDGITSMPTDPEEYNRELRWFNIYQSVSGILHYDQPNIKYKKVMDAENNWVDNKVRIVSIISPSAMYEEGAPLKGLGSGEDKKMLMAFQFKPKAVPAEGTTTIALETEPTDAFAFKVYKEAGDSDKENRTYDVLTTGGYMDEVTPLTLKIENPSDTPVIVDPEELDKDTAWKEAVQKTVNDNDEYIAPSFIKIMGTRADDASETTMTLPDGLKVKLFDKDSTPLYFGGGKTTGGKDCLTVGTDLLVGEDTKYTVDLTTVYNENGTVVKDQTLYLAVQQEGKGDSAKVEIAENSPAPVITEANAKKVVDFETGDLTTGSEVVITKVKKPVYTDARDLVAGSTVTMYDEGNNEIASKNAEEVDGTVQVKFDSDLVGKADAKYYFTVEEPNDAGKVPSKKAKSLKTTVQEASARPVLGTVTKEGATISSFEITGLQKTKDSAKVALNSNDTFTVLKDGNPVTETGYTVSAVTDGKVIVTLNPALGKGVSVYATQQNSDGVNLLPSEAVEVALKIGKPILTGVSKTLTEDGKIQAGEATVTELEGDGAIPDDVELVLKKADGTIVDGACAKTGTYPNISYKITLPANEPDQTFSVIAQPKETGSDFEPSDPAYIVKNSIKPAGITITNNFTAEQESDKIYEVVVAHLEGNVPIGKDDKLYIYKKGDGGAKGDLVATVNATPVSAVMTLADESGVTYEFRHAFPMTSPEFEIGAAGTDLWLEVEQTVNEMTYMKSIAVHMDPVPSEIFVRSVIDPKATDANLNADGIPAVIADEGTRDADQLAAMKPYLFKSRVAIPEGTAISKADLEGYTLNDKVVVEFNVSVTIDGIKSKYHAVPVTWTRANFEEETRTAIDAVTVKPEDATETTPATEIATIEGTGTSYEFNLYGMAYDMSTVLTGTDKDNFTTDDSHNAKPVVTMVVKQMPKLELAEGNWNTNIEGERPEGEEATYHTYVHSYYRDPGFTIKEGGVELASDRLQTELAKVTRTAYEGTTALTNNFTTPYAADELIDIFDITNESKTVVDTNSPTGTRNIGTYKHGDYTVQYVYSYEDTVGTDLITVKNAATGDEHKISITAERKVIVRQRRGDLNLDGRINSGDVSDMVLHALTVSDAVKYLQDNKFFDGYLQYVGDVNRDGRVNSGDVSDLVLNALTVSDAEQYLKQDYEGFLDMWKITKP